MGILDGAHGQGIIGGHDGVKSTSPSIREGEEEIAGGLRILGALMDQLLGCRGRPAAVQGILVAGLLAETAVGMAAVKIQDLSVGR